MAFSKRNCFDNEGNINYSNYQKLYYDFNLIENEMGKIILPGKKMFKNYYHNLFQSKTEGKTKNNNNKKEDEEEKKEKSVSEKITENIERKSKNEGSGNIILNKRKQMIINSIYGDNTNTLDIENKDKNDVMNDIGINEIKLDNQENGNKDIEIFKKTDKNIDNLDKIKSNSLRIKKIKLDGNKNSKRKSENIIKKKSFDEIKKEISEHQIQKDSTEKTKSHLINDRMSQ